MIHFILALVSLTFTSVLFFFWNGGLRKHTHFETETIQGHPRSLILVRIESAYAAPFNHQ